MGNIPHGQLSVRGWMVVGVLFKVFLKQCYYVCIFSTNPDWRMNREIIHLQSLWVSIRLHINSKYTKELKQRLILCSVIFVQAYLTSNKSELMAMATLTSVHMSILKQNATSRGTLPAWLGMPAGECPHIPPGCPDESILGSRHRASPSCQTQTHPSSLLSSSAGWGKPWLSCRPHVCEGQALGAETAAVCSPSWCWA